MSDADQVALTAALREQVACYRRAFGHAEGLAERLRRGESADEVLRRVDGELAAVASLTNGMATARQSFDQRGLSASPELRAAAGEASGAIGRLLAQFEEATQAAVVLQTALGAELAALARGEQMRQAYKSQG